MLKFVKIEYLKFKSHSAIAFLALLFTIFFPFVLIAVKSIIAKLPPPIPGTSIFYEFPTVWDYQGYVGNWLVFFFLGCMVIFMITSEVNYKTQRQNIITGYTKKEYFLGKVYTMLALSGVATIIYTLSTLIIGAYHTPDLDFAILFDNNFAISRFFLMCVGYLSFALMIGMVFKSNGISLFFYLSYVLILEFLLRMLNYYILHRMEIDNKDSIFYWPLNIIEDLFPNPLLRIPDFLDEDMPFNLVLSPYTAVIGTIILVAVFLFIAYKVFMRRDI